MRAMLHPLGGGEREMERGERKSRRSALGREERKSKARLFARMCACVRRPLRHLTRAHQRIWRRWTNACGAAVLVGPEICSVLCCHF